MASHDTAPWNEGGQDRLQLTPLPLGPREAGVLAGAGVTAARDEPREHGPSGRALLHPLT
jgi:hypothetical protein